MTEVGKLAWLDQLAAGGWQWAVQETDGSLWYYRTNKQYEGVQSLRLGKWGTHVHPGEWSLPRTRRSAKAKLLRNIEKGGHGW